jgi:hypothetical protein
MLSVNELFKGRHFDRQIIVLCVRWYLRYKLSFRDLVEMMAERGLSLAHTTIMRWIQRYVPEFEKRTNRFARLAGRSWRVDETYVKIKGRWTYVYRAVDKEGKAADFLLRAKRDVAAAKAFFGGPSCARVGCRIRLRSMAIRPLIGGLQRRSSASNSCIGSGRVSSNSASFASKTKPHLKFGMQCLPRDPRQAPELLLGSTSHVCTTTVYPPCR